MSRLYIVAPQDQSPIWVLYVARTDQIEAIHDIETTLFSQLNAPSEGCFHGYTTSNGGEQIDPPPMCTVHENIERVRR